MPYKTNFQTALRRWVWVALTTVFLLQLSMPVFAQGTIMQIPAPKTQDSFKLLKESPPIWVQLKDWYCLDGNMSESIAYELSEYINKQEARLNPSMELQKKNAENAFRGMGDDYDFAEGDYYLSPKFGPFSPSPGFTIHKSVKNCYTKTELKEWHEFIKKIEKHLLNHPDPLKEAKRLLPNF